MKKTSKLIKPLIGAGLVYGAYCMFRQNKKNMLDVIIKEIETMK